MSDSVVVTIGSERRTAETETAAERELRVRVQGSDETVEASVLTRGATSAVAVDGRVVVLLPLGEGRFYDARGRRVVEVERGRGRSEPEAGARSGSAELKAPMPGRIVRVFVNEGDAVQAGAAIVVIEAMKMENELSSPRAGTVRRVAVQVGDAVDRDALLVEIE